MPLRTIADPSPTDLARNPKALYVFPGTMEGEGASSAAKACVGKPNAVFIPVKRYVGKDDGAFLKEDDLAGWQTTSAPHFKRITEALKAGQDVYWPTSGLVQHARLENNAQSISAVIWSTLYGLAKIYGDGIETQSVDRPTWA